MLAVWEYIKKTQTSDEAGFYVMGRVGCQPFKAEVNNAYIQYRIVKECAIKKSDHKVDEANRRNWIFREETLTKNSVGTKRPFFSIILWAR